MKKTKTKTKQNKKPNKNLKPDICINSRCNIIQDALEENDWVMLACPLDNRHIMKLRWLYTLI